MLRRVTIGTAVLIAAGCSPVRHRVSLQEYPDFEWDRNVRVTMAYEGLFKGWQVRRIEMKSLDGRTLRLVPGQPELEALLDLKVITTFPHGSDPSATCPAGG